jgi:hypothetical protein
LYPFNFHWYVGVVPPLGVIAVKATLVPEQIAPAGFAAILTLKTVDGFTIMAMGLEVDGEPVTQPRLEVITQVIISPFARFDDEYAELVAPVMTTPLFFHWYTGDVPAFTAIAVNVTLVPEQMAPEGLEEMLTLAGKLELTIMLIPLEAAGDPVTHNRLEVISQEMISPFTSAADV